MDSIKISDRERASATTCGVKFAPLFRRSENRKTIQTRTQAHDENGNVKWLRARTVYDAVGRVSVTTDPFLEGSRASRRIYYTILQSLSGDCVAAEKGVL